MNTWHSASQITEPGPETADLRPLNEINAGKTVRIRQLCANADVSCRLREIGFCEGQLVRLIASHTNIICQVCQARLALNNALAHLILVEAVVA